MSGMNRLGGLIGAAIGMGIYSARKKMQSSKPPEVDPNKDLLDRVIGPNKEVPKEPDIFEEVGNIVNPLIWWALKIVLIGWVGLIIVVVALSWLF